jgi:3-hydroxybutyryl-CoA dehydrogenase
MIRQVGVVGCGLMGSGIVEVVARAGLDVVVREVAPDLLERGLGRIQASLARAVERKKLDAAAATDARARVTGTLNLDEFADVDLAIEAVVERMDEKQSVLRALDRIVRPDVILASNTSSLSITEMASVTGRPEQVVGLHFFNPVPVMPLIEIVRGLATSDRTIDTMRELAATLGKTVVVAKDTPGFIVNLLMIPYLLEAIRALELGVGTKEDIDTAIRLGLGHPMGPFTLLDFVGLDTAYYIADAMFQEYKEPRYAPPPLLKRMVLAGWHGRKTGRGFYVYDS